MLEVIPFDRRYPLNFFHVTHQTGELHALVHVAYRRVVRFGRSRSLDSCKSRPASSDALRAAAPGSWALSRVFDLGLGPAPMKGETRPDDDAKLNSSSL